MHHLMRPMLYGAHHRILPLNQCKSRTQVEYEIVGPICESTDVLSKNSVLPEQNELEFVAICDTGAYGYVMASHYNSHQLPVEICCS
jgi:diaminopimelate decarboxylase